MCGRFTQHHSTDQVRIRFDVQDIAQAPTERYNVAPTQSVAVVVQTAQARVLDSFRWGLVPSWAKDPAIGNKMINARAETLTEKPSYRQALSRRRCILPAGGFYEWLKEGSTKQPMHFHLKDGALFGLAGLWEEWRQPDGTPLRTCTVITVTPNELAATVHDRMPAILRPGDEALWLDPRVTNTADVLPLLMPYSAEEMEVVRASRRVNSPAVDDAELLHA